jgi:hypothetical protein
MKSGHFPPPKRQGLILHGVILFILIVITIIGFINLSSIEVGPNFLIWLLVSIFAFAPIPLFAYRMYSLWRADYFIDRDSLAIHWGLRVEDIPLSDIEWIRPADDLTNPLTLPSLSLPGGILGTRRHPDLSIVEFLAADRKKLLLVATAKRIFAISPDDPSSLTQTFARATELGSLAPAEAKSVYPSFVFTQAWGNNLVRYLWIVTLLLNIGLFIWASFIIPSTSQVILGQSPEPSPSSQLIILPVVSLLISVIGWVAGLYFYRWERERVLAFIMWGSGIFMSLLFLLATLQVTN